MNIQVGATLYATTLLLDELTSLSYWGSYLVALTLTLFTAIYTMFGGLSSVIYTDVLQTIVLFAGSFILFIIGLSGTETLNPLTCSKPPSEIVVQPETFWHNKTIVESTPEFFHLINTPHLTGGSSMYASSQPLAFAGPGPPFCLATSFLGSASGVVSKSLCSEL